MIGKRKRTEPSPERLEILQKIADLEAQGGECFFQDVEVDPPDHPLRPDEVDYLRSRFGSKCKTWIARAIAAVAQPIIRKKFQTTVEGAENLKGIKGGAIFTANHFSKFENLAVKEAADLVPGKHRFYRVIKGGNFFLPGFFGFIMRNCDTLPLSTNPHTMRLFGQAMETFLKNDGLILIYPEQAMWWNYKKVRPYRQGAFFYAARYGVPVVPCFTTIEDQPGKLDGDGFPLQKYTVHVLPPIYPDPNKSVHENTAFMMAENHRLCEEMYQKTYC